ncbi:cysteine--tRNA ligase [Virgibacillus halodenitrificans]|jgi:cysteinyl-tRNA synthetase|uniref:Cysteine--tRNA ligase n=1 Tax=Virgibacillus halodenitrificans TaxID=1482 RepID=A0AAC9IZ18_VIRHA|nr:cysteine--tRNA ligase [Virgibacillus halodenitrificans]APC46790.1 cysteine--tRNA ligase [Virgibacillus halodenitrificans]MEC2158197.1 cysteine--tRNA ligase [Virgibacillus halodenitrificans]
MPIQIYNTLKRQKEEFKPLKEGHVSMYVCGPTVYNYIHIGNARPAIVFDTVRRYFEYKGFHVDYVLNFTDVDDKIIKAAKELEEEVPAVAERFIDAYLEDVGALGVKQATHNPRVMETMEDIIQFIDALVQKGFAYAVEGDVYFKPRAFEGYGKLSHQSVDELRSGARIQVGEKKEDPLDFALWKKAKDGEIAWDSPWGEGRPGWHIECSAMVKKYLGDTIDIHAGGQDLTFPHHENEIAQSEAMTGKSFARYWMHNGYINIENEKMSKSLGNFVLTRDLINQYNPQVLRFFMLSVHYRHPINFSAELLESAENSLERIKTAYSNLEHRKNSSMDLVSNQKQEDWLNKIEELKKRFEEEMDDDFNTANAISVIFDITKEANVYLQESQTSTKIIEAFQESIRDLMNVLGVTVEEEADLLDEDIEALIAERNEARKTRDFARADEIRDMLKEKGIMLEDTAQGVRWRRG